MLCYTDFMEKAIIYARYSSDKQTEQSIEGQIRECEAFAKSKGYTIIGKYIDRALTGKADARPDFLRMVKDSHKKLFDYVIVYTLDRFSRSRYDSAHYKHILKKNGVKVLSAKENINDDPSGILMETVLEGMAEYYSAELSVKVSRGMYEGFLKGYSSGSSCYGYDLVPVNPHNKISKTKMFLINENEANIVRKIFADYAGGLPIVKIHEWLVANEIKNRKGQILHENTIMHILKNKKYIGTLKFGDHEREEAIPVIVSKELFAEAQKRIAKNRRNNAPLKVKIKYLLSSKIYCGYDKKSVAADSANKSNGTVYRYYKCVSNKNRGGTCEHKAVDKAWLENLVFNETMKLLMTKGMIEKISRQVIEYNEQRRTGTDLERYEIQLAEVQSKIDNLLNAIMAGIVTADTKQKMIELESEKSDLNWRIEGERLNTPIKLIYDEVVFWFIQFTKGDINDEAFRQRIVDTFINKIILWNEKIIITYNIKGRDGDKITVEEIIADFEQEQANKEKHPSSSVEQSGDPTGIRTPDTAVKGRCLNHLTMGP